MSVLTFQLSPSAIQQTHDLLACLSKFSEYVTIEASGSHLSLSALNNTRSAYGCFQLTASCFFDTYQYRDAENVEESFACQIQIKALLPAFRQRYLDRGDKGAAIDKCSVTIDDANLASSPSCRVLIELYCVHSVTKTYSLTYEETDVLSPIFDKEQAPNRWRISSRMLKDYLDHFGPKAEQLEIASGNGRAAFTSFTDKVTDGKEILKQPLQTSVAFDTTDFEKWEVEEGLGIAVALKDFKSIITHAEGLKIHLDACYGKSGMPLKLEYDHNGMKCEFIMQTVVRGDASTGPIVTLDEESNAPTRRPRPRPPATSAPPPAAAVEGRPPVLSHGGSQPIDEPQPRGQPQSMDQSQPQGQSQYADQSQPPDPSLLIKNDNDDFYAPPAAHENISENLPSRPNAPLFLSFSSSQSSNEDRARDLEEDMPVVGWDLGATGRSTVVARDEGVDTRRQSRRLASRLQPEVDQDEEVEHAHQEFGSADEVEDEEMMESGVGPTQDASQAKGLFDGL